jgi:hypothetical protein
MGGSENFLPYLSQENKPASGRWWRLSWEGEGGGLLFNVNILMKREVFFFPSTNVGVGPMRVEICKNASRLWGSVLQKW